ncbi:MAG: FAD-dependent oxidoreductase [Acidimicrobiales bacterium]
MGRSHCDVLVIGGGAVGLSTAWWLAPSRPVVLLERFEPAHHRGASHGEERIFRYLYSDLAYVEMARAADDGWQRLERDAGRRLLHRVGSVEHGDDTELGAMAAAADASGVPYERLAAGDANRRWPAMHFASDVLLQPTAGWVRAAEALQSLAGQAAAAGVELRFDAPVSAVEALDGGDGVRVEVGDETYHADVVVVTAGAWATSLLPRVPLPPLLTTEEHVFFFRFAPDGPGATGRYRLSGAGQAESASILSFLHVHDCVRYGLEGPSGLVKIGEHHTGTVTTGDERTDAFDPERAARMERYVAEWLPGLAPEAVSSATCLYTSTPTHDFVLDRVGPVVVGAGFSGHGFKFVPEIGRRLAMLATGAADPDPRFAIEAHRR